MALAVISAIDARFNTAGNSPGKKTNRQLHNEKDYKTEKKHMQFPSYLLSVESKMHIIGDLLEYMQQSF